MTFLAWLLALEGIAFAGWLVAAFLLRLGHMSRLIASVLPAGVLAAGWVWASYVAGRSPHAETGWDVVFALLSFLAGAIATVSVLPIWYLAEERLGWRAPTA